MPLALIGRAFVALSLTVALVGIADAADAAPTAASATAHGAKHLTSTPAPRIVGSHEVGGVLAVRTGTWKPAHVTLRIQWLSNGHVVAGATGTRFTVRKSDAGRSVSVTVRGTKHGYRTVTKHSRTVTIAKPASAPQPGPAPVQPPVPAPVQPPAPAPSKVVIPGNGDYRVGIDVAPGTYVTNGATDDCYWERVTSFDGSLDSTIANDIGPGRRAITILPSDYGVGFSRCGTWVRLADAPPVPSVSDGITVVNTQMAPGQYQATAPATGCYWARLSGFEGSIDSIIANDDVDSGQVVVDVQGSDAGFESSGCGTWTRIS